jgi:hypothetical protein
MSGFSVEELPLELQLLLACGRTRLSGSDLERVERLTSRPLDWSAAVAGAGRHGISALLYHHVSSHGWTDRVAERERQALSRAHAASRLLAMRQRTECLRVVRELAAADIEVALLKGVALREWVYPHPELRVSGDIDLLVRVDDAERAQHALVEAGFVGEGRVGHLSQRWQIHMVPMQRKPDQVQLELHWNIIYPPATVAPTELWSHAVGRQLDGLPVWGLCPVHQMIHLCSHAAVNRYGTGLRHLVDLVETARCYQGQIDGAELLEWARRWGVERRVFLSLQTARDLLQAPELEPLVAAVRPRRCPKSVIGEARRSVIELGSGATPRPMLPFVSLTTRPGRARLLSQLTPAWVAKKTGLTWRSPRFLWLMVSRPFLGAWRLLRGAVTSRRARANAALEWWLQR